MADAVRDRANMPGKTGPETEINVEDAHVTVPAKDPTRADDLSGPPYRTGDGEEA